MIKLNKNLIKTPIELFKNIIIEPVIKFDDGLKIISKDPANVCMCIFELPKKRFINYELEKPESFAINLELFDKIINRIKTENIIFNIENSQLIILDDNNKKQFNMAIMNSDEEQNNIPDLKFTSKISMLTKDLSELFLDATMVGDSCKIETKDGKLIISGGELNKYLVELEDVTKGNDTAGYALEYLNKFMSASKYFENVMFEFSQDIPCLLTFENEELKIQFVLAPRVGD